VENNLSAHSCWKKKLAENLTDEQFKKLLIDNGIIVKKGEIKCNEMIIAVEKILKPEYMNTVFTWSQIKKAISEVYELAVIQNPKG
jgi:hypothetical protein